MRTELIAALLVVTAGITPPPSRASAPGPVASGFGADRSVDLEPRLAKQLDREGQGEVVPGTSRVAGADPPASPSVKSLLDRARLQARRGEHQEAGQTLRRALEIAPNSEEVLSAFSRVSLAAREPVPAIRALEPLARMHPSVGDYAYLLGIARLQLGENDGAIETLERALEIEPRQARTLTALGLAFNSQKNFEAARAALSKSLQSDPGNAETLAALAEAEEGLGVLDDAERHAQAALAAAASHAGAHLVLGKIRMNQRRYEEAKTALEKSLAADPTSSKAHYQLSLAYARLGDREKSREHLDLYRDMLRKAEEYLIELRTQAGLGVSGMKR